MMRDEPAEVTPSQPQAKCCQGEIRPIFIPSIISHGSFLVQKQVDFAKHVTLLFCAQQGGQSQQKEGLEFL